MSKAYLAWPVKLIGEKEECHITLKYLGNSFYTIKDLYNRFWKLNTNLDLSNMLLIPRRFNPVTFVLTIHGIQKSARDCRAAVDDIRKDDFPEWNPHITVSKELWTRIGPKNVLSKVLIESIGPLTLYVDKQPVNVWKK